MVNVVILRPVEDTLVFREAAEAKAAAILEQMLEAARRLIATQHVSDENNAQIARLQQEFSRARDRVLFIAETFEIADQERAELWARMPEGEKVELTVSHECEGRRIVLLAERRCARVVCSDFDLIEDDGYPLLERA